MQLDRAKLQLSLQTLTTFGASASPYVGIKLHGGNAYLHRSGDSGYIQTDGYGKVAETPIVASLAHLTHCLKFLQGNQVDVSLDAAGMCSLSAPGGDIKVFTLRAGIPWTKTFDIGDVAKQLPSDVFSGISVDGLPPFAAPPILTQGSLVLPTSFGVARRAIAVGSKLTLSPREEFLRSIKGGKVDYIVTTTNGYWKVLHSGFEIAIAGHSTGAGLVRQYDIDATVIATFTAAQFMYALGSATSMVQDDARIILDPDHGASVQSSLGVSKFAMTAESGSWPGLSISQKTGKLILASFLMDSSETVTLSHMSTPSTFRFARGKWDVAFLTT